VVTEYLDPTVAMALEAVLCLGECQVAGQPERASG
jgi:hypothetical protein